MEKICLERECEQICDAVDLLALIYEDLRCDLNAERVKPHTISELEEFFRIVQCSKSLILTDQHGNLLTAKRIKPNQPVHGYGLRTDVGCRQTIVSHKVIVAKGQRVLPINRLLDPDQSLGEASCVQFVEAICQLRDFYRLLAKLCPKLLDCCRCDTCRPKSGH
jgi:hypothetical protein